MRRVERETVKSGAARYRAEIAIALWLLMFALMSATQAQETARPAVVMKQGKSNNSTPAPASSVPKVTLFSGKGPARTAVAIRQPPQTGNWK